MLETTEVRKYTALKGDHFCILSKMLGQVLGLCGLAGSSLHFACRPWGGGTSLRVRWVFLANLWPSGVHKKRAPDGRPLHEDFLPV